MPFFLPLVPVLFLAAGAGFGAFVGSQVDDQLDPPPPAVDTIANSVNFTKVAYYAILGIAVFYAAEKAGVLKALK
jgi:hypothetical protein